MDIRHRGDEGRYYKGLAVHAAPCLHEGACALIVEHVPKGTEVIELGAGSGAFSERMNDCGYRVLAVDFDLSDWTLDHIPACELDLNNRYWTELEGKRFQCVAAIEVIEHLENVSQFLRNVRRLLSPNGLLLLTTPNVVDLDSRRLIVTKGEFWLFRRTTLERTGHLSIVPYWLLEQILAYTGFRVVTRRFIGRKDRSGWGRAIVPLANLFLLPFGYGIPLEAAFGVSVAYVCKLDHGQEDLKEEL